MKTLELAAIPLSVLLLAGGASTTSSAEPTGPTGRSEFIPGSAWKVAGYERFRQLAPTESPDGPQPMVGGVLACEASEALPRDVPHRRYAAWDKARRNPAEGAQHILHFDSAREATAFVRRMKTQVRQSCLKADRKEYGRDRVRAQMYGTFDGDTAPRSTVVLWASAIDDLVTNDCSGLVAVNQNEQVKCKPGRATDSVGVVAVGRMGSTVTVLVLNVAKEFQDAPWKALLATGRSALQLISPLSATL